MPNHDPIKAAKRRSAASRRVGIGARCACGEDRPLALIPGSVPPICAECQRRAEGRTIYDQHHPAGKSNHDFTIPIPVNDHRAELSELQYEWPKETLRNPDQSPLRAAAGCIRGSIETIKCVLENLLAWIARFLEILDEFLTERLGSHWWTESQFMERWNREG
jgi:hypothetical protein